MALDTLADAFYDELRDILSAERQLSKALPKMAKKAGSEKLAAAFREHAEQTEKQIERLEAAFEDIGKPARAKTCEAMKGLIAEADSLMKEKADADVLDALLIAAAQKVEHYEIATYGTLCTWAELLGYKKALALLKQTMSEEENTDKKLTQLSTKINPSAVS